RTKSDPSRANGRTTGAHAPREWVTSGWVVSTPGSTPTPEPRTGSPPWHRRCVPRIAQERPQTHHCPCVGGIAPYTPCRTSGATSLPPEPPQPAHGGTAVTVGWSPSSACRSATGTPSASDRAQGNDSHRRGDAPAPLPGYTAGDPQGNRAHGRTRATALPGRPAARPTRQLADVPAGRRPTGRTDRRLEGLHGHRGGMA